MKKIFGIAVIIGIVYLIGGCGLGKAGADETYLLPSGFEGCVVIKYDVEDAEPLKIENNEIIYKVPESGIIETSSPFNIGWGSEDRSGPHQIRAFYVDGKGEKIEELSHDKIRYGATGSYQEEGKNEKQFFYQIFGSKETEAKGCPPMNNSVGETF